MRSPGHHRRLGLVGVCLISAALVLISIIWGRGLGWGAMALPASLLPVVASIWVWVSERRQPEVSLGDAAQNETHRGGVLGAGAAGADIEAQLVDLRSILEAMDEPVLVTGSSGVVELCNRACGALLGRPAERILGRAIEDLFTQVEVLGLHSSAAAGRARRGQIRIAGETGPRFYQVLAAPIAWRGGQKADAGGVAEGRAQDAGGAPAPPGVGARGGVVLALRDVTELAIAVNLKTDFVANASHEFRTPLSSIKAAVETLADGAAEDVSLRERFLRMISGNVERLEDLTRDLLDLSRLESAETAVEMAAVPVGQIEASLRELFEPVGAAKRLKLVFEWGEGLETLRTDRRLVTLILKNLIDNAMKFAYEGTAVRVAGQVIGNAVGNGGADGPVGGGARAVRLQVTDEGVGIPIANQARVFERFYQVDLARTGEPARRGTGLGLAIVKHAVKALGGTIAVQSVWQQGTTMTVELPGAGAGAERDGAGARGLSNF